MSPLHLRLTPPSHQLSERKKLRYLIDALETSSYCILSDSQLQKIIEVNTGVRSSRKWIKHGKRRWLEFAAVKFLHFEWFVTYLERESGCILGVSEVVFGLFLRIFRYAASYTKSSVLLGAFVVARFRFRDFNDEGLGLEEYL